MPPKADPTPRRLSLSKPTVRRDTITRMSQDPEIPPWRGVKTFYPEMTLQVDAPTSVVVGVLARELSKERFRIKDVTPTGFKASYTNWFDVVSGSLNRTSLDLEATPDGETTHILINATSTADYRTGQKHASRGLSAAVSKLRADGHTVTTTPWVVPEARKKGKRR